MTGRDRPRDVAWWVAVLLVAVVLTVIGAAVAGVIAGGVRPVNPVDKLAPAASPGPVDPGPV